MMTPEQYLDARQVEVFTKIAESMGLHPIIIENECIDFINNAEQRWELLEWYIKTAKNKITDGLHAGDMTTLTFNLDFLSILGAENPPRQLVLVAMDMLGIGE